MFNSQELFDVCEKLKEAAAIIESINVKKEKKPTFTSVLRKHLSENVRPDAEFTANDVLESLRSKNTLPNGKNPHARVAQSCFYLEATGHIKKTHVGRLGKRDPHKYKVTEKCLAL